MICNQIPTDESLVFKHSSHPICTATFLLAVCFRPRLDSGFFCAILVGREGLAELSLFMDALLLAKVYDKQRESVKVPRALRNSVHEEPRMCTAATPACPSRRPCWTCLCRQSYRHGGRLWSAHEPPGQKGAPPPPPPCVQSFQHRPGIGSIKYLFGKINKTPQPRAVHRTQELLHPGSSWTDELTAWSSKDGLPPAEEAG